VGYSLNEAFPPVDCEMSPRQHETWVRIQKNRIEKLTLVCTKAEYICNGKARGFAGGAEGYVNFISPVETLRPHGVPLKSMHQQGSHRGSVIVQKLSNQPATSSLIGPTSGWLQNSAPSLAPLGPIWSGTSCSLQPDSHSEEVKD